MVTEHKMSLVVKDYQDTNQNFMLRTKIRTMRFGMTPFGGIRMFALQG
jgi:hypothetical protein